MVFGGGGKTRSRVSTLREAVLLEAKAGKGILRLEAVIMQYYVEEMSLTHTITMLRQAPPIISKSHGRPHCLSS